MPRNAFARLDEKISASVDRKVGEPCTWIPMLPATGGDAYDTANLGGEDTARGRVEGIVAAVTWKPAVQGEGSGAVAGGSILVEMDRRYLAGRRPRKGDRFELPEQDDGERLVEIRNVSDDGGARIDFWCTLVVTR